MFADSWLPLQIGDECNVDGRPEQPDVARVLELQGEQQQHHLDRLRPAVDVVAEEQVGVGRRRPAQVAQEGEQVGVLAVQVAQDSQRRVDAEQRPFGGEDERDRGEHIGDAALVDNLQRD